MWRQWMRWGLVLVVMASAWGCPADDDGGPSTLDMARDTTTDPGDATDPVIDPISDPIEDPLIDAEDGDLEDPAADPVVDPSEDPTSDPITDPVDAPLEDPIPDPLDDPLLDPTEDWIDEHPLDLSDPDVGPCVPSGPELTWSACTDGEDNDCDGATDWWEDPQCTRCPPPGSGLRGPETTNALCGDGLDNDCDGYLDCRDFDCDDDDVTLCSGESSAELCSDGLDNDGDGRVDCLQRTCAMTSACRPAEPVGEENTPELCGDGYDDDWDGYLDCDDSSCEGIPPCAGEDEDESDVACDDGLDNDGDGFVDCRDLNCIEDPYCTPAEETDALCQDGMDNDNDGTTDCGDTSCYRSLSVAVCSDTPEDTEARCDDTFDNDHDGATDCDDPQCTDREVCLPTGRSLGEFDLTDGDSDGVADDPPLLITEIMANPAVVDDAVGEYVEVWNHSEDDLDVFGLSLSEGNPDATYRIDTHDVLPAGGVLLFIVDDTLAHYGDELPDLFYETSIGLNQGGDFTEIAYDDGTSVQTIHHVAFDDGAGLVPNDLGHVGPAIRAGQSFNLDQDWLDGAVGSDPIWCLTPAEAAWEYANDIPNVPAHFDYGTPSARNVSCD